MIDTSTLDHVRQSLALNGDPAKTRVVVAMSGGVDSSVAAGLVKAAGYETIGITLQLYDQGPLGPKSRSCCAGQDIHDARRAAAHLDIAHYVLDFESRFRESVIDEFADAYVRGETPVPCITCNRTVKFADLLSRAKALGAACLVTGHYIDACERADGSGHRDLLTPADASRDQSYFLYATTQDQIDYLRFPLGGLTKTRVRELGHALGLAIAEKPDSQDICFVPNGRYTDIVARLRPEAASPGNIVHVDGRVLGQHEGICGYTIGQRRGLGIGGGEVLYVARLDAENREVIVGPREALLRDELVLRDVNWLGGTNALESHQGAGVHARIRSTRPPVPARVTHRNGEFTVTLLEGDHGISPGQACVFYETDGPGSRMLGGGTIASTALAGPKPDLSEIA